MKRLLLVLDPAAFDMKHVEDMVGIFKDDDWKDIAAVIVFSGKPDTDIKAINIDGLPEATVDELIAEFRLQKVDHA